MKWGIAVVALIIAGATYYFWTESYFTSSGQERERAQERIQIEARMSEGDPPKVIPQGAIMEDGTVY